MEKMTMVIRPKIPRRRRPDGRKIRDTKTYTISELAQGMNCSEATVMVWIAAGMPCIDYSKPVMIYGWEARIWLREKWEKRRSKCGPTQLWCCSCKAPRQPLADCVVIAQSILGSARIEGICDHCGTQMFGNRTVDGAFEFQKKISASTANEQGFIDSDTSSNKEGDFDVLAGSGAGEANKCSTQGEANETAQPSSPGKNDDRTLPDHFPRNPHNERLKRDYLEYLREAKGRAERSIRKDEGALSHFEHAFGYRDFGKFDKADALFLKSHLKTSGLSGPSIMFTLQCTARFLCWLRRQRGYASKVNELATDYLNLTTKERRSFHVRKRRGSPSPEIVTSVMESMPRQTPEQWRDRALIALLAGTGIRISAAISLSLKHIDTDNLLIWQYSQEVDTKFSKNQVTTFFQIEPRWEEEFRAYVKFLREELGFDDEDPLFPATRFGRGKGTAFQQRQIVKEHWKDIQMAGRIVKRAFTSRGICPTRRTVSDT